MGRIEQIRAWKQRWGYDDAGVMPGGRPMKDFSLNADKLRALAETIAKGNPDAAQALRGPFEELAEQARLRDALAAGYDPAEGPLATSIANRIRDRAIVDRTAAIDQVTGKIYSTDRRDELMGLTGDHYLAKAFGLRAIKQAYRDGGPQGEGILFDHQASSIYQRDALSPAVVGTMVERYGLKKVQVADLPDFDANSVFFVNDSGIAAKLDKVYTAEWVDPNDAGTRYQPMYRRTVEIDPGVHALIMEGLTGKQATDFREKLLAGSGSTPSAYQIEKVKDASAARDPLTDPALRSDQPLANATKLGAVAGSRGCKNLAQLPDRSPVKHTAQAASKMVTGLNTALGKLQADGVRWAALQDNKLVHNALQKIERLMETMPTYTEDAPRFARLFDLLVDEVYLVLVTCKPYGAEDYRAASNAMINERIPTLTQPDMGEVRHQTALLSGGMDCLSTAVAGAFAATGATKLTLLDSAGNHSANYFEVEAHLLGAGVKEGVPVGPVDGPNYKPPVIMGTLNPSTPVKQMKTGIAEAAEGGSIWTVDKLIAKINGVLEPHLPVISPDKPAVAIIDVTVERNAAADGTQEMDQLVRNPIIKQALADGKLQLMLAKSYQKYPNLGAGKAMSGGLTFIGKGLNPDAEPLKTMVASERAKAMLPDSEREGALKEGYDEAQIVIHFMTHEREAERAMLQRAAAGARFVAGFIPDSATTNAKAQFDEGLPFISLPEKGLKFKQPDNTVKQDNVSKTLHHQGVEDRNSFGFQNTSCLTTNRGMMRIGLGQESHEDLVEKLYAVTTLAAQPVAGGITAEMTMTAIGKVATKAMAQARAALDARVGGEAGDQAWRQRMVRVLSEAGLLKEAVTPPDDELTRRLNFITADPGTHGAQASALVQRGADADWRRETVALLIEAGRLKTSEVVRHADNGEIVGPADEELHARLKQTAFNPAEPALARLGQPDALHDVEWRNGMVTLLLNAGQLKPDAVDRNDEYEIIAPTDDVLIAAHQRAVAAGAAVGLGPKLALAGALRRSTVDEPVLSVGTRAAALPEKDRRAWIDDVERRLKAKNQPVPPRVGDGDDAEKQHVRALQAQLRRITAAELAGANPDGVALKQATADVQAFAALAATVDLGMQAAEAQGGDRLTWIADAERALRARGIELPQRGADGAEGDKPYVKALREALHGADDASLMHAHAAKTFDGPGAGALALESKYLPNIVASYANLMADKMNDKARFIQLSDVLIGQGLQDMSPEGRERLLTRRVQASLAGTPAEMAADLGQLEKALSHMPYGEGAGRLALGRDLSDAVQKMPADEAGDRQIQALIAAMTSASDITTQGDIFSRLVDKALINAHAEADAEIDSEKAACRRDDERQQIEGRRDARRIARTNDKTARRRIVDQYRIKLEAQFNGLAPTYLPPTEKPSREAAEGLLRTLKKEFAVKEFKAAIQQANGALSEEQRPQAIGEARNRIALGLAKDAIENMKIPTEALEAVFRKLTEEAETALTRAADAAAGESSPRPALESAAERPMAAGDLRRGAQGVDTHGPQPMTKVGFDALQQKFRDAAARLV